MKKVLSGLVLASAFVLTACGGGSSDSSGSNTIPTPLWAQKASYLNSQNSQRVKHKNYLMVG